MSTISPNGSNKKHNTTIIIQSLDQLGKTVNRIYNNRIGRLTIQIIIILICLIYLKQNLSDTKALIDRIQINYAFLLTSWALTIIVIFLGALGWWLILKGFGQTISGLESTNIHLSSNLAKYIPGYAWQILGKAFLTRREGIPTNIAGLAITTEIIQLVLTGVLLILAVFPEDLLGEMTYILLQDEYMKFIKALISLIILMLLIFLPFILNKYQLKLKINLVDYRFLWGSTITISFGWLLLGLSLWFLGLAFYPLDISLLKPFTFALSLSYILGLAIIIIPASIGVREGILVYLLSSYIGGSLAVLIAILFRIIITISEIIAVLCFKLSTSLLRIGANQ